MTVEPIPFDIREQLIQCFGKCFHYKDTLVAFLVTCGLENRIAIKYKEEYKFVWGKKLFSELNETDEGRIKIKKIISGFYQLRNLPDSQVVDKDAGLSALRKLKELVVENKIVIENQKKESVSRSNLSREKEKIMKERQERLEEIKSIFFSGFSNSNRQQVGYSLEEIIKELFSLSSIEYRKSYKTDTQQIDGYFRFEGFDYLVEAKWRNDQPNEGEIGSFQRKINTKLESTRGVFFSISGFREEVVKQYDGEGANIIFFTGEDLALILEGRIELTEVLIKKIEKAAQYGYSLTHVRHLL